MAQAANRLVLFPGSLVPLTARHTRITRFDRRAVSNLTVSCSPCTLFFHFVLLEGEQCLTCGMVQLMNPRGS